MSREPKIALHHGASICAENVEHDRTASPEAKAWSEKLRRQLRSGHTNSADHDPRRNAMDHTIDCSEEDDSDDGANCETNHVYKLQVLYGTNLQGADMHAFSSAPRTSDPYVVALCSEKELARSAITPQSVFPLFRKLRNLGTARDGFSVDIPNEIAFANTDRAKAPELVLQVYDHDSIGSDNFLGEARLRADDLSSAINCKITRALQPSKTPKHHDQKFVGGELHFAGHLVAGKPSLVVHVLGAHDLDVPTQDSCKHVPPDSNTAWGKKGGVRLSPPANHTEVAMISSFVICYWDGEEIGRTDVKRNTRCPRWGDDPENVFQVSLSTTQTGRDARVWRRQYCPELKFEVFDTVFCCIQTKACVGHLFLSISLS